MYEGGGLVGDLSSIKEKTKTENKFMPVKAMGKVPVDIPVRIKSVSKTLVLPEIDARKPGRGVRSGSTIPVFDIITGNASRNAIVMSLGVEDMV